MSVADEAQPSRGPKGAAPREVNEADALTPHEERTRQGGRQ